MYAALMAAYPASVPVSDIPDKEGKVMPYKRDGHQLCAFMDCEGNISLHRIEA